MWKLNNSHLKSPEFVFKINNTIEKAKIKYQKYTPDIKWKMIKCDITADCIDFSNRKAKENKLNINLLYEKVGRIT